jgi:hypothetical protein
MEAAGKGIFSQSATANANCGKRDFALSIILGETSTPKPLKFSPSLAFDDLVKSVPLPQPMSKMLSPSLISNALANRFLNLSVNLPSMVKS